VSDAAESELDALAAELLDCYEELTILYGLSAALSGVYDENQLADIAIDHAVKAIGAAAGMVAVPDGDDVVMLPTRQRLDPTRDVARIARGESGPLLLDPAETNESVLVVPVPSPDGEPIGALALAGRADGSRFDAGTMKLASAVASQLGAAIHANRLLVELQAAARIAQELEIAASIQQGLLPSGPPDVPGVTVVGRCIPAAKVGGDLFDHIVDDDGNLSLLVADVAGHSIASALLMAMTRSLLRREAHERRGPAAALAAASHALFDDLVGAGLFVTVFSALYDPTTATLRYSNGAHNPALLRRADGTLTELDTDGMALGIVDDWPYEEGTCQLGPGDLVVLYTDGVTEARSPDGELYGEARLADIVAATAGAEAVADAIVAAATAHAEDAVQDDLTVLVLEVKG
jgi:sigma-B regulation protein RsbU (phosphoserine phosphatase)